MRFSRATIVLAAAFTLALAAVPAKGATPSAVSDLGATVSGTTVNVTGTAAFGGQDPVTLGDDAVNDNQGGATTAAYGVDLDALTIAQPDPAVPTLRFTIDLSGLSGGGIPEHIAYNWDIRVDGGTPQDGFDWSIKSWRTRVASTGGTNPYAAVFTCSPSPTGGSSCSAGPQVPVIYDTSASAVIMDIPLDTLSASPGSKITAWNRISAPVWTGGTFGTQTLAGFYDTATHSEYVVPSKTVKLGIAPAGGTISYTTVAALNGSSFSGSLTVPGPGTYDVGAQACFATNCSTGKVTITV